MTNSILKSEVKDAIKKDPVLYGVLCKSVGASVRYGLIMLTEDNPRLTNIDTLRAILPHTTYKTIDELVEIAPAVVHNSDTKGKRGTVKESVKS